MAFGGLRTRCEPAADVHAPGTGAPRSSEEHRTSDLEPIR
jgi:hypothetical protein